MSAAARAIARLFPPVPRAGSAARAEMAKAELLAAQETGKIRPGKSAGSMFRYQVPQGQLITPDPRFPTATPEEILRLRALFTIDKILKPKSGARKTKARLSPKETKQVEEAFAVLGLGKTPVDVSKLSKKEIAELIEDKFPINFGRPHGRLTAEGPPMGPDVVKKETQLIDAITKLRGRRNVPPPPPMGPPTKEALKFRRLLRRELRGGKKITFADVEKTKPPPEILSISGLMRIADRARAQRRLYSDLPFVPGFRGRASISDQPPLLGVSGANIGSFGAFLKPEQLKKVLKASGKKLPTQYKKRKRTKLTDRAREIQQIDLDNYARIAAMGHPEVRKELVEELQGQLPEKEFKFFIERVLALGGDAPMGTKTLNPTVLTELAKLKPQDDFVAKMVKDYQNPKVADVIKNLKDDSVDELRQEAVRRISSGLSNPLRSIVYASMTSPAQKRPTEIATGLFAQLREVGGVQVGSRNYGIADFSSKPKDAAAAFGKAMRQNPDFKKAAVMSQEFPDNKKLREMRFREAMDEPIETPVLKYVKSDEKYMVGSAQLPALSDLGDIDTLRRILGAPRTP